MLKWSLRSMLLALLVCAGSISLNAQPAHAWTVAGCTADPPGASPYSTDARCIGHRVIRARGGINPECLVYDGPGGSYPNDKFCKKRLENIAHARAVAYLGTSHSTQWELQVHGTINGRADISNQTSSALEVFEVKVAGPGWGDPFTQVQGYVSSLNELNGGDGVDPTAEKGPVAGGGLSGWVDTFLVQEGTVCAGVASTEWRYTEYVTWQVADGVVATIPIVLPCFNPATEPIPVPETVPAWKGHPVPLDDVRARLGYNNGMAHPVPGTIWSHPPVSGGGPPPDPSPQPAPVTPTAPTTATCCTTTATNVTDPHMATFDGLSYDLQSIGEFQLVESDSLGLDVQIRTVKSGEGAAVIRRVAADVDGYDVEVDATAHHVLLDHADVDLDSGYYLDLGDNAWIKRTGDTYTIAWPGEAGDERPQVVLEGVDVTVHTPRAADIVGLDGNADGNPYNDLVTSGGDPLTNATPSQIHGTYADSWRVDDGTTLFTYDDGETTADYTDTSWPAQIPTIDDLDDATLAEATTTCATAGVVDGPQFDSCVVDWAQTRSTQFVSSMAQLTAPLTEPGARTVDATGSAVDDFDGSVAPNYSAARYASNADTGTYAGPFARTDRYVYYLPELPRHAHATLTFDVVALGDWTALDGSAIDVSVDGNVIWTGNPATATPTSTGTTSTGQSYAIYPVTVTVPHIDGQLRVGITADLPLGSIDHAWGIDDVATQLELVPPQHFSTTLPATISNGVPATGAGNLETPVSEDDYDFTATDEGALTFKRNGCGTGTVNPLSYKVIDTGSGAAVGNGVANCDADVVLRGLAPADYELAIDQAGHHTETYNLQATWVDAQHFAKDLPFEVDGAFSLDGTGNLETLGSEDEYRFTTATTAGLQLDVWGCATEIGNGFFHYELYDMDTGASVAQAWSCTQLKVSDLPAGDYRLIFISGGTGTYNVRVGSIPPAQTFPVSLPQTVSDGDPAIGAGSLETLQSSQDDYGFTTTSRGALSFKFTNCATGLDSSLVWELDKTGSGDRVDAGRLTCGDEGVVHGQPADQYTLKVSNDGHQGTYHLQMTWIEPQVFDVSLPLNVSDGRPATGAGNLEVPGAVDEYRFTSTATGDMQVDIGQCVGLDNYGVFLDLRNATTGASVYGGWSLCDHSFTIEDVPAGDYTLDASHGPMTGTYDIGIDMQQAPQSFALTSFPKTISDGDPAYGAGNLETTSSEDDYTFTITSPGALEIALSQCDGSLGGSVRWTLTNTGDGHAAADGWVSCDSDTQARNLPAGDYKLAIARNGKQGTYTLALDSVAVQHFDVSLPLQASNGSPSTGAGNMESPASEDQYLFTVDDPGTMQLDLGHCGSGIDNYGVFLNLQDVATGQSLWSGWSLCDGTHTIADVPVGDYRLSASHGGQSGTYELGVSITPAPQSFALASLPATITDGVPAAGAGKLETTSSEDDYTFTTTSPGALEIALSECDGALGGSVQWTLTDTSDGHAVTTGWVSCNSDTQARNLPAGDYQLAIAHSGQSGAYKLKVDAVGVQHFDVTLPFSTVGSGAPSGSGTMESPASEDQYLFTVHEPGTMQLDLGHCGSGIDNYGVFLDLRDATTGASVYGGWSLCDGTQTVPNVPAGDYRLSASHGGQSGTYELGVGTVPPAQSFAVTSLPQTVSDGVPAAGAGNLETTSSEDDYTFTTLTTGALDLGLSDCASSLDGSIHWILKAVGDGHTVADNWLSCNNHAQAGGLPAGDYKVAVLRSGKRGSYKLALDAVSPQQFDVTLPVDVADGSPSTGAGNLETGVSEDIYAFAVGTAGKLQLDSSDCSGFDGLGVYLNLVDTADDQSVWSGWSFCGFSQQVNGVATGDYALHASRGGQTGTYKLGIGMVPPPQSFAVTSLPQTISDGDPATGAGNLETTSSEDDYTFTTVTTGALDLGLSDCASSLSGSIHWILKAVGDGHTVADNWLNCNNHAQAGGLPPGDYKLAIVDNGKKGTYELRLDSVPPQRFSVALPFSVSDGLPSTGAGNLETPVSEDIYGFSVATAGALQLHSTSCSGLDGLGAYMNLVNTATNQSVWSGWSFCGSTQSISDVPIGDFDLHVARGGSVGTYAIEVQAAS
jgi:hypothetical protein